MDLKGLNHLIVGAGFWGATLAERIASELNEKVLVIDRRNHIGGNSYSEIDSESGIEVHKYGSHIFHTKDETVWSYINNFSKFNNYQHRVLTTYQNAVYPMPISLATINQFYGLNLKPAEVTDFIASERARHGKTEQDLRNLEDKAISLIGEPLYRAFIEGYTAKQWERDPTRLPASIITRLPVRSNYNLNYFDDPYQGIPVDGYSSVFQRMLKNQNINLALEVDYFEIKDDVPNDCQVYYSGPVDRYFDYKFGELEWRSLRFEKEVLPIRDFQGTSVMNYADREIPYTRIHEFKHYHPERNYDFEKTVIFYEYSKTWKGGMEPYYPVNTNENHKMLEMYRSEALGFPNVIFGGRLGQYRYWDMEQAIRAALDLFESRIKRG